MSKDDRRLVSGPLDPVVSGKRGAVGTGGGASYTLIGAIILLGGIGYAVDSWRGTSPWFLLAGLLLGLIVGFVDLARFVWKK